jgi:hypothetical protein
MRAEARIPYCGDRAERIGLEQSETVQRSETNQEVIMSNFAQKQVVVRASTVV